MLPSSPAGSTTCALVTMRPWSSRTKPEPVAPVAPERTWICTTLGSTVSATLGTLALSDGSGAASSPSGSTCEVSDPLLSIRSAATTPRAASTPLTSPTTAVTATIAAQGVCRRGGCWG